MDRLENTQPKNGPRQGGACTTGYGAEYGDAASTLRAKMERNFPHYEDNGVPVKQLAKIVKNNLYGGGHIL